MNPAVKLLFGLCALAVLLLGLKAALRPDPARRGVEFFPDMVRSKAATSQGASAALPLGMVQQPLVEGVVVRGSEDFPYGPGPEEAARAGRELASPLAGEDDDGGAGALLYARFCGACHGTDGAGRGPVVERGMFAPPSFKAARAMSLSDGEIYHIITTGQNNMAPHGAQVGPLDRWRIIRHLRVLQGAP